MALLEKIDNSNIELIKRHNCNNEKILQYLEEFKQVNNLTSDDFVVGGSAAGSYLDYMVIKGVRDVDVILLDPLKEVERTKKIDIIRYPYWTEGFKDRAINKDGINFCCLDDLIEQEATAALVKKRLKNIAYTGGLLEIYNISYEELYQRLEKDLIEMQRILPEFREEAIKSLPFIKRWFRK